MAYVPERGDLAWVSLDPHAGHEQHGRRPVLVLSPRSYNRLVGLCVVCPITTHPKGYVFEVALPGNQIVAGVILADQIKSIDWRERRATFIARSNEDVVNECVAKATSLIEPGA